MLPCECLRIVGAYVEMEILFDSRDMRPADRDDALTSRTPCGSEPPNQRHEPRADACSEDLSADLELHHLRLRAICEFQQSAVDAPDFAILAVDQFLVEYVADNVHVNLRRRLEAGLQRLPANTQSY